VRKAVAAFEELGYSPITGPELEFFLCVKDESGLRRYVDNLSMVYTVGPQADPKGVVRQITEALSRLGFGTFAANHEFMNSQYEINLRHAPALNGLDRAFRLKSAVKDVAAIHGPARHVHGQAVQRPGRLGFHIHFSLDREDDNAFADHGRPTASALSSAASRRHPRARARADRVPEPDDQRLPAARPGQPRARPTPTGAGTTARASSASRPSAGRATRVEVRVGDGSANPYLATAALLFAGLHGVRDKLQLGPPVGGDAYTLDDPGEPLPTSLDARSTRSRPTSCCARPWAHRSSTRSWPSSASSSNDTARGCRTGSSASTSTTLGRHDHAAADRPG
jgi:glutamine synthetase